MAPFFVIESEVQKQVALVVGQGIPTPCCACLPQWKVHAAKYDDTKMMRAQISDVMSHLALQGHPAQVRKHPMVPLLRPQAWQLSAAVARLHKGACLGWRLTGVKNYRLVLQGDRPFMICFSA